MRLPELIVLYVLSMPTEPMSFCTDSAIGSHACIREWIFSRHVPYKGRPGVRYGDRTIAGSIGLVPVTAPRRFSK